MNGKFLEWEGSYAYSSIVGQFLQLQISIISLSSLRIRGKYPSQFLGEKFMDTMYPSYTLQILGMCFLYKRARERER
jgi:hypothetical protein